MRFTGVLAGIGFLVILRVGVIKFLVGEYVGEGGRGILLRTLVFNLGDGRSSREPNRCPTATESEFINVKDCNEADDRPPLRSLSNLAFKSFAAVEAVSSRLVGLEGLERIEPLGFKSVTS